jgi:O-antigen ligase
MMKTWEIVWVAVGIVLTTATQLRRSSLPVGPGEVMLAIWILFIGIEIAIARHHSITPITKVFFWFWIASFTSLVLGLLSAESIGFTSLSVFHDTFAFAFVFSFSMVFLIRVSSNQDLTKILSLYISFAIVSLSILLIFPRLIPFFNVWYGGARFTAWSKDPNQLALLLSTMPFFSLYFFQISKNKNEKFGYFLLMLMSFILGTATQSDSLRLWWIFACLITIFLMLYRWLSERAIIFLSAYKIFVIKQILILGFILTLVLLGCVVYEKVYAVLSHVYSYGSQGSTRLTLWGHAIAALSHSPIFGLGPGAHSGYTGPFLAVEAHNTFIDWTASYGIVGLICYVSLLAWVGRNLWKNGSVALLSAFISLIGYSVFVYTLRHIIFWFSLLTLASLSIQVLNQNLSDNRERVFSD